MIEQSGAELFMFSTTFPHPEGYKDPLQRFDDAPAGPREEDASWRARWERGTERAVSPITIAEVLDVVGHGDATCGASRVRCLAVRRF